MRRACLMTLTLRSGRRCGTGDRSRRNGRDAKFIRHTPLGRTHRQFPTHPHHRLQRSAPRTGPLLRFRHAWTEIPRIRLHMVREYLLGIPSPPLLENIRTANARLQGAYLTCILVAPTLVAPTGAAAIAALGGGRSQATSSRDWTEEEYCVDTASALLRVYSPAPGIYVEYNYGDEQPFHGHIVPDAFAVTEAGNIILQGTVLSGTWLADPLALPACRRSRCRAASNCNGLCTAFNRGLHPQTPRCSSPSLYI